jgi:uncharacterized YigZ family protein
MPAPYRIPAGEHRTRDEISRSRFVTTLAPAPTVGAAHAFVARVRAEFPDATHHCWAFVVGPPGSTGHVGLSDDGEPHGTAGRPMLTALLHAGVGDVAAVVTRYYGGTKLGTGGLARAYGGGVAGALATLPTVERVTWVRLRAVVGYDAVTAVQQLVAAHGGRVAGESYAADVRYDLDLPDGAADAFARALRDATRGRAQVEMPAARAGGPPG